MNASYVTGVDNRVKNNDLLSLVKNGEEWTDSFIPQKYLNDNYVLNMQ